MHPSLEILALSRGRGVPEKSQAAFKTMKLTVARMKREGLVIASEESVIGLEGETRLCVVFKDHATARATHAEFNKIGGAVDLLVVREVACEPK